MVARGGDAEIRATTDCAALTLVATEGVAAEGIVTPGVSAVPAQPCAHCEAADVLTMAPRGGDWEVLLPRSERRAAHRAPARGGMTRTGNNCKVFPI